MTFMQKLSHYFYNFLYTFKAKKGFKYLYSHFVTSQIDQNPPYSLFYLVPLIMIMT